MGCIRSTILLSAGVAIGGTLYLAHRVSQETGKNIKDSFLDVPTEAQKLFVDVKDRAEEAVAKGREAYQQRQAEVQEQLQETPQA